MEMANVAAISKAAVTIDRRETQPCALAASTPTPTTALSPTKRRRYTGDYNEGSDSTASSGDSGGRNKWKKADSEPRRRRSYETRGMWIT